MALGGWGGVGGVADMSDLLLENVPQKLLRFLIRAAHQQLPEDSIEVSLTNARPCIFPLS